MKILVTGGAGFIGSNFIRHMLNAHKDVHITNLDKLTYAGNLDNLRDIEKDGRYSFVNSDITDVMVLDKVMRNVDAVVNFAAETHVDRSIHLSSEPFIMTNIVGVRAILEMVKRHNVKKYVQISTDEVYGSLELDETRKFAESSQLAPNSPYSATKACGDLICRSYFKSYGTPVIVTRCSNNYGPFQYPEKVIPFFTMRAMAGQPLTLYGDGRNVRDWIHVIDHCKAIDAVLAEGAPGEVYNIGADNEVSNLELTKMILKVLGKPESLITFIKDRPGHDRRYAIDSDKIRRELGWSPDYPKERFYDGLREAVEWYLRNMDWVENIKKKAELDPLQTWESMA
jgi:dTDP-glucose 4,6-dehydratase